MVRLETRTMFVLAKDEIVNARENAFEPQNRILKELEATLREEAETLDRQKYRNFFLIFGKPVMDASEKEGQTPQQFIKNLESVIKTEDENDPGLERT